MNLTDEQIRDVRAAVKYYMQRQISINSPRYQEYSLILEQLTKILPPHT